MNRWPPWLAESISDRLLRSGAAGGSGIRPSRAWAPPYPRADFGFGVLTGWVWVPNSASSNATSSFEPIWIMMISFSLGWSKPADKAFRTIGFPDCFRFVSWAALSQYRTFVSMVSAYAGRPCQRQHFNGAGLQSKQIPSSQKYPSDRQFRDMACWAFQSN